MTSDYKHVISCVYLFLYNDDRHCDQIQTVMLQCLVLYKQFFSFDLLREGTTNFSSLDKWFLKYKEIAKHLLKVLSSSGVIRSTCLFWEFTDSHMQKIIISALSALSMCFAISFFVKKPSKLKLVVYMICYMYTVHTM